MRMPSSNQQVGRVWRRRKQFEAGPLASGYKPLTPAKMQVTSLKVAKPPMEAMLPKIVFIEHRDVRSSNTNVPLAPNVLEPTQTSLTVVAVASTTTTQSTRLPGVEVIEEGAIDCPISLVG